MATPPSSRRRRSLRPRRWQGGQPSGGSPRRSSSRDPTWRPIAPTLVGRQQHAMASVPGGKVYAIGGGPYYAPIATVSGYDPATNAWAAAPSLGTARSGLAAAVLNGTLYALGGFNGLDGLTLVETFTPTAAGGGTWATGTPMRTARRSFGAAAVGGAAVARGGGGRRERARPRRQGQKRASAGRLAFR